MSDKKYWQENGQIMSREWTNSDADRAEKAYVDLLFTPDHEISNKHEKLAEAKRIFDEQKLKA